MMLQLGSISLGVGIFSFTIGFIYTDIPILAFSSGFFSISVFALGLFIRDIIGEVGYSRNQELAEEQNESKSS